MSYDCYCDYDAPAFFSKAKPRARKPHRCIECSGDIRPGEVYEYSCGVWDGYFSQHHICERCTDLRQWVQNNLPCFCWAYGSLHDDAAEAVREARYRAKDETAGLLFGFLRRRQLIRRFNSRRAAERQAA